MVPIDKVKDIITKHNILEKELSSGNIDSKLFAKKSKEYSSLGEIINIAKEYGISADQVYLIKAEFR